MQQLLHKRADVGAKTPSRLTALQIAALMGCKEIVHLLLKKGADIAAEVRWQEIGDGDAQTDNLTDSEEVRPLGELLRRKL